MAQQHITVFISGSRSVGKLPQPVKERINNIIDKEFDIVVGDSDGIDAEIQQHLMEQDYPHVVVYYSGDNQRNNMGFESESVKVPSGVKGREFYTVKDRKMAEVADYAFVIWDGKSEGSFANVFEMLNKKKKALVYLSQTGRFVNVGSREQLEHIIPEEKTLEKLMDSENIFRLIGEVFPESNNI